MGTEVLKIYIVLAIILVIILGAGVYYILTQSLPELPVAPVTPTASPDQMQPPASGDIAAQSKGILQDIDQLARGSIQIVKNGKNKITITWTNLPEGTTSIVIFRSSGNGLWVRWKTVPVGQSSGGSADIALGHGENASNYSYYAQAFTPDGFTLWASPIVQAELPPPPPPVGGQTPTSTATSTGNGPIADGGNKNPGSGNPPQATSTPPSPTSTTPITPPSGNPTSTTPNTPPPDNNPPPQTPPVNQVAYYTPDGKIAGYYTPQTNPFWVLHVNQSIEIGWQNLPPPTNVLIVYRSASQTGPWDELLNQKNPSTSTPDFVRLIDYTISDSYYYRMDALSGTNIIAAYEPIFLEGITN